MVVQIEKLKVTKQDELSVISTETKAKLNADKNSLEVKKSPVKPPSLPILPKQKKKPVLANQSETSGEQKEGKQQMKDKQAEGRSTTAPLENDLNDEIAGVDMDISLPPSTRSVTPPLEEVINGEKLIHLDVTSPVSTISPLSPANVVTFQVANAGLFPQVVTTNIGFLQYQQQPAIAQKVTTTAETTIINRGISSVLALSSERSTPRSLKEWSKQLEHTELDDFCMKLIEDVKSSLK